MAGENDGTAELAPRKTQEQLNVEYYGRVYEIFLKRAEELGKARGWTTEHVLEAAGTMFYQYQNDQVALAKDEKLHRKIEPLMEQLQRLGIGGR